MVAVLSEMIAGNEGIGYLVINAQQTALQAQLNLATIQRQELDAKVELYRSLGGGWK